MRSEGTQQKNRKPVIQNTNSTSERTNDQNMRGHIKTSRIRVRFCEGNLSIYSN